jgi:hypothetical protein
MVMKKIIDLGKIPLVNNLFNTAEESFNAKRFYSSFKQ